MKTITIANDANLRAKYGLTQDFIKRMARAQEYRCLICGKVPDKFVVDHDHSTKAVRGLLCIRCNTLVGFIETSELFIDKALEYVYKPRGIAVSFEKLI